MGHLTPRQQLHLQAVTSAESIRDLPEVSDRPQNQRTDKDPVYIAFSVLFLRIQRLKIENDLYRVLPDLRDALLTDSFTRKRLAEGQRAANELLSEDPTWNSLRGEVNEAYRAARRLTPLHAELQLYFEEHIRLFRRFPYGVCVIINELLYDLRDACFKELTVESVLAFIEAAELILESKLGKEAAAMSAGVLHASAARRRLKDLELSAMLHFAEGGA